MENAQKKKAACTPYPRPRNLVDSNHPFLVKLRENTNAQGQFDTCADFN
jgi:hypothetical protein